MERPDAIIVGGNVRGLVAAYVLDQLGYRTVLIERAPFVGGADSSFVTAAGTRFDHGFHVVDYMRSELVTKLFTHVLDGRVRRQELHRGIVLRDYVVPYAPAVSELPAPLREMFDTPELVDHLGDAAPTREALAAVYGRPFTSLIFDEVLPSYPTEVRHAAFGVDESELLINIYPWFFPRAARAESQDESRAFHDKLRRGETQEILYPEEGGFGAFAQGFSSKLERCEVLTQTSADFQVNGHRIEKVSLPGRTFESPRVLWAGAWPGLCKLIGLPCQDVATDRVMVGSYRLDKAPVTRFCELLVGNPTMSLNRVYFPGKIQGNDAPLIQVEYAVPVKDERYARSPEDWKTKWTEDLRRLGIMTDHEVVELDYRAFNMHFNAYGCEGERLIDADPTLISEDSNVVPIVPSMANLNLNRYVPRVVRQVTGLLE